MKLEINNEGSIKLKLIFIDAYNVINIWPSFKELKNLDLEIVRQKLVEIMENYAVFNDYKVFLVFDAHSSSRTGSRKIEVSKNLSVIFTKQDELADTYIERIVHKIGKKYEVLVVTSDYLEQQIVFQGGAYRVSSLEFYKDVYDVNNRIRNESKKLNSIRNSFLLIDSLDDTVIDRLEKIRKGY